MRMNAWGLLVRKSESMFQRPCFSYLTIFLLQLKVMWQIWTYRDLTFGDTSSYFRKAYDWYENFSVDIAWSPLYTAFYGTFLHVSEDPYVATILHRLVIVLAIGMLVLALARRLLPHGLAWAVAAWWAVLPINFDAMYEVHLFAVIPALAACLVILRKSDHLHRGACVAMMFGTTVLVRNEYIVPTAIIGMACLAWEFRLAKTERATRHVFARRFASYALPMAAVLLVIGLFYLQSEPKFPILKTHFKNKHALNMCQVFAYGYKQRHPEWSKNPMTDCKELLSAHFGKKSISLSEMFRRNPRAITENVLWNLSLTCKGVQVLLFDAMSGSGATPDYRPVNSESRRALVLSICLGVLMASGIVLLWAERAFWWEHWLKDRFWGWLVMLSWVAMAFVIILTQRPRPSYLFAAGIFLMSFAGMCAYVVSRRFFNTEKLSKIMPVAVVLVLFATPAYYPEHGDGRPLLERYRRLAPFEDLVCRNGSTLVADFSPQSLANYVCHDLRRHRVLNYSVFDQIDTVPLSELMERNDIDLAYVNKDLWSAFERSSLQKPFPEKLESSGWDVLALRSIGDRWMVLGKESVYEKTHGSP